MTTMAVRMISPPTISTGQSTTHAARYAFCVALTPVARNNAKIAMVRRNITTTIPYEIRANACR
jgi:hypothetical protein